MRRIRSLRFCVHSKNAHKDMLPARVDIGESQPNENPPRYAHTHESIQFYDRTHPAHTFKMGLRAPVRILNRQQYPSRCV